MGFSKIYPIINNLKKDEFKLTKRFDLPKYLNLANDKFILSNFFLYLIPKIIKNEFGNKVNKLSLDYVSKLPKFSKKIIADYTDPLEDWQDNIKTIFYIASFRSKNKESVELYKKFLTDKKSIHFYKNIQNNLFKFIKSLKPKKIIINKDVSYKNIRSSIKLLINDNLFDIKTTENQADTISNLCQSIMKAYLLKKNNILINKVSIYNIISGQINTYDISKIKLTQFQKIIYTN